MLPDVKLVACVLAAVSLSTARVEAAAARPSAQRVAILAVDFQGGLSDAGRQLFNQRLAEGLEAAEFQVLSAADVAGQLSREGGSECRDPACYPAIARTLGVSFLIVASVVGRNKTYDIAVQLVNGKTGALVATDRSRCETCGIEEAGEKMSLASAALRSRLEALTRQPARFVIRSTPPSAKAVIDGKPVGRTPVDVELPGGEHRLMLALAGHQRMERSFTAVSGVDETLHFSLAHTPSTFPYRAVGWAAIAIAAASFTAGIWAVTTHGDEIDCTALQKDERGNCPYVRKTAVLGAALVGVGAVFGSLGGLSLYMDRNQGTDEDERTASRTLGLRLRGAF